MLKAGLCRLGGTNYVDLFRKNIPFPMRHIVDVGASLGYYSLLLNAIWPEAEIWAFEPSSINFRYLMLNTGRVANVRQIPLALGDERQRHTIAVPTLKQKSFMNLGEGNSGVISLLGDSEIYREEVQVVKLDDVVDKCDFLKVDTEGYEYWVLKGADRILREERPFLHIETMQVNFDMAGIEPRQLFELILSYDYVPAGSIHYDSMFIPREKKCSS